MINFFTVLNGVVAVVVVIVMSYLVFLRDTTNFAFTVWQWVVTLLTALWLSVVGRMMYETEILRRRGLLIKRKGGERNIPMPQVEVRRTTSLVLERASEAEGQAAVPVIPPSPLDVLTQVNAPALAAEPKLNEASSTVDTSTPVDTSTLEENPSSVDHFQAALSAARTPAAVSGLASRGYGTELATPVTDLMLQDNGMHQESKFRPLCQQESSPI